MLLFRVYRRRSQTSCLFIDRCDESCLEEFWQSLLDDIDGTTCSEGSISVLDSCNPVQATHLSVNPTPGRIIHPSGAACAPVQNWNPEVRLVEGLVRSTHYEAAFDRRMLGVSTQRVLARRQASITCIGWSLLEKGRSRGMLWNLVT